MIFLLGLASKFAKMTTLKELVLNLTPQIDLGEISSCIAPLSLTHLTIQQKIIRSEIIGLENMLDGILVDNLTHLTIHITVDADIIHNIISRLPKLRELTVPNKSKLTIRPGLRVIECNQK